MPIITKVLCVNDFWAEMAVAAGQDVRQKVPFRDQSWKGTKTRSRDATLSRYSGVEIVQLQLQTKITSGHSGEVLHCLDNFFR